MFADLLSRYWWMTMVRGVVWIVFGLVTFARPGLSLLAITVMFAVCAIVDGLSHVLNAFSRRHETENWWLLLLSGLAGIGIGMLTLINPALTALALLFYIAIWAIATGLLQFVAAIQLRKEITGELWLALSGLLSIGFGVLLMARPGAGVISMMWLIGGYAIVGGVLLIALAFTVRGFSHRAADRLKAAMSSPRTGRSL